MKAYNYILSAMLLLGGMATSCNDEWDNHYSQKEAVINNAEMEIVDEPAIAYLESQSEYSSMVQRFKDAGVLDEMQAKDLLYTVFVVDNSLVTEATTKADDQTAEDEKTFITKGHITTASLSPNSIREGQRLLMWNNKYVDIQTDSVNGVPELTFAGSHVKKVVKVNNGYIYELDKMISTPKSLLEIVEGLSDDYSIFKEAILSRNQKTFDKANSLPIGVDASGNTIYDSVFVVTNPYFANQGLNLSSETSKATMLIPSNKQINNALAEGRAKLKAWNLSRPDTVLTNWFFQAMFFKNEYKPEDFRTMESQGTYDITSIFDKQWRFTVNTLDLDNPVTMSNGTAYYIKSLKLPVHNVLIWRFKELFTYYKKLSPAQRDSFYVFDNVTVQNAIDKTEVKPWTPGGGWPQVSNIWMRFVTTDKTKGYSSLTYTPHHVNLDADGNFVSITTLIIPSGKYMLHMGIGDSKRMKNEMDIYINGVLVKHLLASQVQGMTGDRGGGGYPEFFNPNQKGLSNATKYDRDGPEVGEVEIQNDELKPITITFKSIANSSGTSDLKLEHWCLRPTEDNY